jgi:membrane fusion protein, copper/silver efflux system
MVRNVFAALTVIGCLSIGIPATYAADDQHADQHATQGGMGHKAHGVVNSVDAAAGKINITHDPIDTLKWPKMKMNFKAHDAAMLKDIKPGMTVNFEIQKMGNEYHITSIAPAQ